eukprot:13376602-Ditylum_brightwellii.AAC.1
MSYGDIASNSDTTHRDTENTNHLGSEDNKKKCFDRRKRRLLYEIITKKKKKRVRGSAKKRKKEQQHTIRQFFETAVTNSNTDIETDPDTDHEAREHLGNNKNITNQNPTPQTTTDNVSKSYECRGGDKLDSNISSNIFQLSTNNVNGFNTANDGDEFLEELTILKELKISAACFQETNKNWTKSGVYNNIKRKLFKVWRKNKITMSCAPEWMKSEYQPGGTATLVTDKWSSFVCDTGKDTLGRWSYTTFKGKHDQKVTVISAYRVCNNTLAQAGPQTCWKQQWCFLRKK